MKSFMLTVAGLFLCMITYSQSNIVESLYLFPKIGQSQALESAIAAHNKKYHPAGDGEAMLRYIDYGEKAGWYVWVLKGTYATLDNRPTDSGHVSDWAKNVEPNIAEYGSTTIWRLNTNLSTGVDMMNSATKYRAWSIEFEDGQGYRFAPLMEKMVKVQKNMGRAFVIYNSAVHFKNGPDVAIVWPFDKYAEWDENSGVVEAYEKEYGTGSWVGFMDEWRAIVKDYDEEIRSKI
ncbi:hypothetical protein [Fulvivirga sedimenti]|uniref:Uncharacterized protein n=1 Tax=Fulvivirga sedimenti TaxID=2879465 RepID=A0A9X1L0A5_9BACT|nr:hypothetical protein [Fulvivirga sedimenti]MCA6075631.1 hypothetical protein [Fulvivirga sedimenti]